jgi:anaphase-promoting complex subunit 6
MLKLNRGDQAKNCFMEALALDVKCFDAFQQLVNGEMMTPDEGIHQLQCIDPQAH